MAMESSIIDLLDLDTSNMPSSSDNTEMLDNNFNTNHVNSAPATVSWCEKCFQQAQVKLFDFFSVFISSIADCR